MRGDVYKRVLRLVSVVMVLNLAFGGFLGLMLVNESAVEAIYIPPPVGGTVYIDGTGPVSDRDITWNGSLLDNGTLGADWNLNVINGGKLTLIDLNLVFQSDTAHRYSFLIDGGEVYLINSTITVKTTDVFDNYLTMYWFNYSALGGNPTKETNYKRLIPFNITVTNSIFDMSDDSALEYEGDLYIEDSTVSISDSVITSPNAPYSTHKWGVVLQIVDCFEPGNNVIFADARIEKSPWYQGIWWYDEDTAGPAMRMYANHTITNSDVYFINTYFDLDYQNKTSPHMWVQNTDNHFPPGVNPNHNALNIYDSTVKFYGLTIDMDETGNQIPIQGSTAIEVKDPTSVVALYRWLEVAPLDNQSVPVENASIDVSSFYGGDALIEGLNDLNNNVPVWNYIQNKRDCILTQPSADTINAVTGTSGKAIFALVSDYLTESGWPNSDQKDGYNINASYINLISVPQIFAYSNGTVDFENFPRVLPQDNFVNVRMDPFNFGAPHPELSIAINPVPPTSVLEGIDVNITVIVTNEIINTGVDVDDVKVQFWDGDPDVNGSEPIDELIITYIAAGTSETRWITWNATPSGAHTIYVYIDRDFIDKFQDNLIPEINENDNMDTASITVNERPDLSINATDILFKSGGDFVTVIVNGTDITINANIRNFGGSDANNVEVRFYDGTALGPGNYIDHHFVDVPAGGSVTASAGWRPYVGYHYVWIIVDETDAFLESDEGNNRAFNTLDVKSRPDLRPDCIEPLSPVNEGEEVTISASIINDGGWNVTQSVTVKFYYSVPDDPSYLLGTVTIPVDFTGVSIPSNGGSVETSVTWTAEYPPALWTFYVRVDPDDQVVESDETNNLDSVDYDINPRPNLKVEVTDIVLSDAYPINGTSVQIDVTIWNTGESDITDYFHVQIWLDEIGTGTKLTVPDINVSAGILSNSSTLVQFLWLIATPPGLHDLWIYVDTIPSIDETSETDNMVSVPITIFKVPSDLIVNDTIYGTLTIANHTAAEPWNSDPYTRDGFTLVEESGTLIIDNSIFKVIGQSQNDDFNIVVKDSGTLIIEGNSQITSENYHVYIYLYDNAKLYINASIIDSMIDIKAFDNAQIFIDRGSSIKGQLYADDLNSNVYINVINSTFTNNMNYIGGGTFMELWGVDIAGEPASETGITVTDNAKVYINWFLTINTVDVNEKPIEGATVTWFRSPPWNDQDTSPTLADGAAYFWVRGMNITSTGVVKDIGNYRVEAYFTSSYTMMTYYPDAYVTVDMTMNKEKTMIFPQVMPDLDPPLFVTAYSPPFAIGSPANITAWVNNTGSNTAYDVWVRFDDNISQEPLFPKSVFKASIPANGSWMITFDWYPTVLGWHNITMTIDPNHLIIEEDEDNNLAWVNDIYVQPQKADLYISGLTYNVVGNPYGPTENDTLVIQVSVTNLGETDAYPVEVDFYLGDAVGPITWLGDSDITGVSAGQTEATSFNWVTTTPPGPYWIWVVVDESNLVDETDENNNDASIAITIKGYADVDPIGIDFEVDGISVTSVTDKTQLTIIAEVRNQGETEAVNVQVTFFDGDPFAGAGIIGTTQTISLIGVGTSGDASVVWLTTVEEGLKYEIHSIYVQVSITKENFIQNNEDSGDINVTLRPILSVRDISFSDDSPFEDQDIQIFAYVENTGGTDTTQFFVTFYDGDPSLGDQIGAPQPLTLAIDEIGNVGVTWSSPSKGSHEIHVVADSRDDIDEADETNNEAYEIIAVYSGNDIIVNDANTPQRISRDGETHEHRGYTLVEEQGVLRITYTTFKILQTLNHQYNIIVRNNGTLIIEDNSVIDTDGHPIRIYLYDDATLIVEDSIITSNVIEIQAFRNAKLYINGSTINSFIKATSTGVNVRLYGTNSTLSQAFQYFGGTSEAKFINVYTPSVVLSEDATLKVYKWLKVYVKDGAGGKKTGATVVVRHYLPPSDEIPGSPKITDDEDGLALFDVLTDEITATEETSYLNYRVEAIFNYQGTNYTGMDNMSFTSYLEDKVVNTVELEIELSQLRPDLNIDSSDISFSKGTESRVTVGAGEEITVSAVVHNIGTTDVEDVVVRFYHEMNDVRYEIGEDVIEEVIAADGGTGTATITWIPTTSEKGDNEPIWVVVDPDDDILELIELNFNEAFTGVKIVLPPDLSVINVYFDTGNFTDIDNVTESREVTIRVVIRNGETDYAASNINVSAFMGFPDYDGDAMPDSPLPAGVEIIDYYNMGSTTLIPGQSTTVELTWDTTGSIGGHSVYVYVLDETDIDGYIISDQILNNNNASKSFLVLPQPDMYPTILPPQTTNVTLYKSDGTTPLTGDPLIGENVVVQATIYNNGQVYISGVDVSFFDGDPTTTGVQLGSTVTIDIGPRNYGNASITWNVNEPAGPRTIYVWVNRYQDVLEIDYTNNMESDPFNVSFAPILVWFTELPKENYKTGETIKIRGMVTYTKTPDQGIPNLAYEVMILNADDRVQIGDTITGTSTGIGVIYTDISAPTSARNYYVRIEVTYGGSTQGVESYITVKEKPTGIFDIIPLWLFLLVIIIAIVVILLVGVLLARYGLGRLVECGECGAFIPEGEKKCPKCGAVFETDTAKCSECGAWIPVDSKSCPDCGAIFTGLEKEKKDYIESMKLQYTEYVDQYRNEAASELGDDMTDEEFMDWWKANPKFIGFEEWLAREEELKKGRTKNCPGCNTINPESAAICFKCGSVFKEEEELDDVEVEGPPPEVPAKRVPPPSERVVERKTAPPTVVPKKVVQPPEVVPKKVVKAPPTVVPKKVVKPPEDGKPVVVPKKVVKRPPEEE